MILMPPTPVAALYIMVFRGGFPVTVTSLVKYMAREERLITWPSVQFVDRYLKLKIGSNGS